MGTVYLGHHRGQAAAIKVIHPQLATDYAFRSRFVREAEISSRVSGPFFATTIDCDLHAEVPWIASEYITGPTVQEWVSLNGPFPADRLMALGLVLINALRVLHDQGIVHRDLKPANVILSPRGPVLIDFGIAAALDLTSLTAAGSVLGSAGWMSPEQVVGAPVTAATDVFAWGAVLAFAGSGRPPFGHGTSDAIAYRVVEQAPAVEAMPALADLASAAMAKDPAGRPTAGDLLATLSGRVSNAPTVIATQTMALPPDVTPLRAISASDRSRPQTARKWILIAALALVVASSVFLAIDNFEGQPIAEPVQAATPNPSPATTIATTGTEPAVETAEVTVSDCGVGAPSARPTIIILTCADGNEALVNIEWEIWEPGRAYGSGELRFSDCVPSCAEGEFVYYLAAIDLYAPSDQVPPEFTRAGVTYLQGSPRDDGRTTDVWTLITSADSSAEPSPPPPDSETAQVDRRQQRSEQERLLVKVPISAGLIGFNTTRQDSLGEPDITDAPLVEGSICGTSLRPRGTIHRSASAADLYPNRRELFVFRDADRAVAFLSSLEAAAQRCSFDNATGSVFQVRPPLTGYPELNISEFLASTEGDTDAPDLAVRHYLRVGSAVFAQVRYLINLPRDSRLVTNEVARVAGQIGPQLCGFTEAGC